MEGRIGTDLIEQLPEHTSKHWLPPKSTSFPFDYTENVIISLEKIAVYQDNTWNRPVGKYPDTITGLSCVVGYKYRWYGTTELYSYQILYKIVSTSWGKTLQSPQHAPLIEYTHSMGGGKRESPNSLHKKKIKWFVMQPLTDSSKPLPISVREKISLPWKTYSFTSHIAILMANA